MLWFELLVLAAFTAMVVRPARPSLDRIGLAKMVSGERAGVTCGSRSSISGVHVLAYVGFTF